MNAGYKEYMLITLWKVKFKYMWNRNKNNEKIKLQEIAEFVLFSFPIFCNQKSPLIEKANKKL